MTVRYKYSQPAANDDRPEMIGSSSTTIVPSLYESIIKNMSLQMELLHSRIKLRDSLLRLHRMLFRIIESSNVTSNGDIEIPKSMRADFWKIAKLIKDYGNVEYDI